MGVQVYDPVVDGDEVRPPFAQKLKLNHFVTFPENQLKFPPTWMNLHIASMEWEIPMVDERGELTLNKGPFSQYQRSDQIKEEINEYHKFKNENAEKQLVANVDPNTYKKYGQEEKEQELVNSMK